MPSVTKVQRPWLKHSESQSEKKTDPFYLSTPWRKSRACHLALNPICYYCELGGHKHIPEPSIVDHYRPRRLYPELELSPENFRTSCDYTHNIKRQWESKITTVEQFERLLPQLLDKFKRR